MRVSGPNTIIQSVERTAVMQEDSSVTKDDSSEKKKQIVVERTGEYACTYIINERGDKVLINKVPIDSPKVDKDNLGKLKSIGPDMEYGKLMYQEAQHKRNLKDTMDLIGVSAGMPIKNIYED